MDDCIDLAKSLKDFKLTNAYQTYIKSLPQTPSERKGNPNSSKSSRKLFSAKKKEKAEKVNQEAQTLNSEPVEQNGNQVMTQFPKQYKSARENPNNSMDKQDVQNALCPLNDPDLPPVCEIDHVSSRCFCDLCTCGLHICPYVRRQSLYPISMFRTQYNNNYIDKGTPKQDKMTICQGYKLTSNAKIETLTTKMQDFKPIQLPKSFNPYFEMKQNRPNTTVLPSKFICSTQYQHNYPN